MEEVPVAWEEVPHRPNKAITAAIIAEAQAIAAAVTEKVINSILIPATTTPVHRATETDAVSIATVQADKDKHREGETFC